MGYLVMGGRVYWWARGLGFPFLRAGGGYVDERPLRRLRGFPFYAVARILDGVWQRDQVGVDAGQPTRSNSRPSTRCMVAKRTPSVAASSRLLQRDHEQVAARVPAAGHRDREQCFAGCLFLGRGRKPVAMDLPVAEHVAHLVLNVLLEAADHQPLVAEVLRGIVVRIGDCGRVQHVHQAGEAARLAVVRGRGEHDKRVGGPRQQARDAAANEPLPRSATLWASSMTITSQHACSR